MIEPLKKEEFNKIRDLLVTVCGIVLSDDQDYLVETRLTETANEIGARNFAELHMRMKTDKELLTKVVDLMTTNETLWFRDESCWITLREVIIPELISRLEKGKLTVRIWSAAASTGQESYSLLILIHELLSKKGRLDLFNRISVVGTDISNAVIYLAKRAVYDQFTISRGMSKERLAKYFTLERKSYKLNDEIKKQVNFKPFNLMDSFMGMGPFDLVLCRNVAIYFSSEFKKELFDKISRVMTSDGFFMLGATESLIGLETNFKNLSHGNGLYYALR